jgi:alkylation response protein AidB-like acyl-CoA dehydrogenase
MVAVQYFAAGGCRRAWSWVRSQAMSEIPCERAREVAARFAELVDAGALDLPLPGSGGTLSRWQTLASIASDDLCVARLAEAHTDALATLAELGAGAPPPSTRWGLWAARPPGRGLTARRQHGAWILDGEKQWCSGARSCTHALVTAETEEGYRLFAVELAAGARPRPGGWAAPGMAGADTLTVDLSDVPAAPVGEGEEYLTRPGFRHGAIGVAACWYGGAAGLAAGLCETGRRRPLDPHALAHLGAIDALLAAARDSFAAAAAEIDGVVSPECAGEQRAARVRAHVEWVATEVAERVGRALGPALFANDARYGNLLADLPVYLRQSHAERDLERLGVLALESALAW